MKRFIITEHIEYLRPENEIGRFLCSGMIIRGLGTVFFDTNFGETNRTISTFFLREDTIREGLEQGRSRDSIVKDGIYHPSSAVAAAPDSLCDVPSLGACANPERAAQLRRVDRAHRSRGTNRRCPAPHCHATSIASAPKPL